MLVRRDTLLPWGLRERINGILYQPNIEAVWSADQLAAIGLYAPIQAVIPEGHVAVGPITYQWTGSAIQQVVATAPAIITPAQVKAEAQRRIMALMGAPTLESCIIKQLNANMRANELNDIRHDRAWTQEEQDEATALKALAAAIKAIRSKSDQIEAISPIPFDFAADSRWA